MKRKRLAPLLCGMLSLSLLSIPAQGAAYEIETEEAARAVSALAVQPRGAFALGLTVPAYAAQAVADSVLDQPDTPAEQEPMPIETEPVPVPTETPPAGFGYIGYSSLEDLDNKAVKDLRSWTQYSRNSQGQGLSARSYWDQQCVTYVLDRSREKLFGASYTLPMWSGNANQMVENFLAAGFTKEAAKTLTGTNGVSWTVRTYPPSDGAAGIQSNSIVCLTNANQRWSQLWSWSVNAQYGHAIYVEEVAEVNGTQYVYFTEGGAGFKAWPVKRMKLTDLYNSGVGYLGSIVFQTE